MKTTNFYKYYLIASFIAFGNTSALAAFDDAETDYSLDEQDIHVWSEALEPIDLVNSILCFTKQMRANEFINQGPYRVLADESMCFDNEDDGSAGQSSGADNAPSYMQVVVDATQASNTSPLQVSVWIPSMGVGEDNEEAIKFKAVIREGASNENPFGDFRFNYEFFNTIDDLNATGGGEIRTINNIGGKIGFTLYDSSVHDGNASSQSASVVMNANRSEGIALTASSWGGFGQAYALSFNDTHVLQQSANDYASLPYKIGNNSGQCLSRTAFNDAVWRYDLYDSLTGERVDINSGFPIRYDSDNDTLLDSYGHVGYWGLWSQDDTLQNGDIVTREDPQTQQQSNYTVVKAPGRLIRYTMESLALAQASGIEFYYWDDSAIQAGYDLWSVSYLTIAGDGAAADGFYRVAGMNWTDGPPNVTPIAQTVINLQPNEVLHLYSNQLGGDIRFLAGESELQFYRESFVNGSETESGELLAGGSVQLHCFDRCLKGNLIASNLQDYDGINGPFENSVANVASAISYNFSATGSNALTLVRNSNSESVAYDGALTENDLLNSPHNWGVRSGPMVTAAVAATLVNPWDVYNNSLVSEFYVWESGINPWNQLITVKDSLNNIPVFDRPLQLTYVHSDANDRSGSAGAYDARSFMLNYGGNGDLWGIPQEQVSGDRWEPVFNLADGTLLGANSEFVVKAREVEQSMADAAGECNAMTITDPVVAVPGSILGTADIGNMPDVDAAPAVIAGELQITE